jgi:hypothetical protein
MRGCPGCMRARHLSTALSIVLPPRVPPSVRGKPGGNSIPQLTHPVVSIDCDTLSSRSCHGLVRRSGSRLRGSIRGPELVTVPM